MTVFTCGDSFDEMMTCVYEAWASRLGHSNIRLEVEPIQQTQLFCDYVHVEGNKEKSDKVIASIKKKISWEAYRQIFLASCSFESDRLDAIYRFLVVGFFYGKQVVEMMTETAVIRMMELSRKVGNEAHFFREFTRFTSIEGKIYIAHIEPKSNVLIMTAEHFADRMPSEYWIIVDDSRRIAAVHPRNDNYFVKELDEKEWKGLSRAEDYKDEFTELWKEFFRTIAIEARRNPKCQRNMMPIWYRKHVTEFEDEVLPAASTPKRT